MEFAVAAQLLSQKQSSPAIDTAGNRRRADAAGHAEAATPAHLGARGRRHNQRQTLSLETRGPKTYTSKALNSHWSNHISPFVACAGDSGRANAARHAAAAAPAPLRACGRTPGCRRVEALKREPKTDVIKGQKPQLWLQLHGCSLGNNPCLTIRCSCRR